MNSVLEKILRENGITKYRITKVRNRYTILVVDPKEEQLEAVVRSLRNIGFFAGRIKQYPETISRKKSWRRGKHVVKEWRVRTNVVYSLPRSKNRTTAKIVVAPKPPNGPLQPLPNPDGKPPIKISH